MTKKIKITPETYRVFFWDHCTDTMRACLLALGNLDRDAAILEWHELSQWQRDVLTVQIRESLETRELQRLKAIEEGRDVA